MSEYEGVRLGSAGGESFGEWVCDVGYSSPEDEATAQGVIDAISIRIRQGIGGSVEFRAGNKLGLHFRMRSQGELQVSLLEAKQHISYMVQAEGVPGNSYETFRCRKASDVVDGPESVWYDPSEIAAESLK